MTERTRLNPLWTKSDVTTHLASLTGSTSTAGLVELANTAETLAGTDATRAVTPAGLSAANRFQLVSTVSASRALLLTDYGKMLPCSSASTIDITVPLNSSVAFDVETEIVIARTGAGAVTVSPASGSVTVLCAADPSLRAQGSVATLKKIDTNTWILMGDLNIAQAGGTYTPVVANWSNGTGGSTGGFYEVVGNYCTFNAFIEFASGSSFSGALAVSLPPVAASTNMVGLSKQPILATYTDSGTAQYFGRGYINTSTQLTARFANLTTGVAGNLSSTSPFTWAEGDFAFFTGTYRIA